MKITTPKVRTARKGHLTVTNSLKVGLAVFALLFASVFSCFTTYGTAQADPLNPQTTVVLTGPETAEIGSTFTYTINVSQQNYKAQNLTLTLPIEYGLEFVSGAQVSGSGSTGFSCSFSPGNSSITCIKYGDFEVGETASFTVQVRVTPQAQPGRDIYTYISVTSDNNTQGDSNEVITHIPANVSVSINGPAKIQPGNPVAYKVQVKNSGTVPVSYINLTENYPAELAFVSSDMGDCTIEPDSVKDVKINGSRPERTIYCELLDIQPGETRVVTLNFLSAGDIGTCFVNTASTEVFGARSLNVVKNFSAGEISTTSLTTCFALPTTEIAPTADVVAQLRVTPDTTVKIAPTTDINYTLTVKNIGAGSANRVRINFPYDPNLTVGYATFSDPRMWVSAVVSDAAQPYVTVEVPDMQNNEEFTATLVLRPSATATEGANIFNRFTVGWDDGNRSGNSAGSNGVHFALTASDQDNKGGEVQLFNPATATLANGQAQVFSGDFFAPNEMVTFWYTNKDGNSTSLGTALAGPDGSISISVTPTSLVAGQQYVIAGHGNRSGVYGSSVITISA